MTFQPQPEQEIELEFTVRVRSFGNPTKATESAARAVLLGLARTVPNCEVLDATTGDILALDSRNFRVERFPEGSHP